MKRTDIRDAKNRAIGVKEHVWACHHNVHTWWGEKQRGIRGRVFGGGGWNSEWEGWRIYKWLQIPWGIPAWMDARRFDPNDTAPPPSSPLPSSRLFSTLMYVALRSTSTWDEEFVFAWLTQRRQRWLSQGEASSKTSTIPSFTYSW